MHNTQITAGRNHSRKPVSARRAAAYQRPASAGMLPERLFDSRIKLAAVCPETALMYAVLEDAFLCFHQRIEREPQLIERAREAEDWFFSDDSRWLFSFLSVCATLSLEPHYIRKKLRQWTPACLDNAPATR
ncbi:MAG TPA: hypothetical protein VK200_12490 [Candidatus Limnocylindrales bacterium]|nr:hypothetical protein [Candidatus Limnocylindrales bacterium]